MTLPWNLMADMSSLKSLESGTSLGTLLNGMLSLMESCSGRFLWCGHTDLYVYPVGHEMAVKYWNEILLTDFMVRQLVQPFF